MRVDLPTPLCPLKQCYLALHQLLQFVYAMTRCGRNTLALITHGIVELHHHILIVQLVGREQVTLVEHQHHGNPVGLSRSQETVYEGCAGFRIVDSDNEESLIDIGGNDVTLLGEVGRLTDDIVLRRSSIAVIHPFRRLCAPHPVANRHRIGATDTFQAEVSLHLIIDSLAIVQARRCTSFRYSLMTRPFKTKAFTEY